MRDVSQHKVNKKCKGKKSTAYEHACLPTQKLQKPLCWTYASHHPTHPPFHCQQCVQTSCVQEHQVPSPHGCPQARWLRRQGGEGGQSLCRDEHTLGDESSGVAPCCISKQHCTNWSHERGVVVGTMDIRRGCCGKDVSLNLYLHTRT